MAAVTLQMIPSFYTIYSKNSLFISANTYEKYFVSKEYCIAGHVDKMCFLPNCRYHIILIGNIKELLQKLDASATTNRWTACIHFSSTASVAKLFSSADNSLLICRGRFFSTSKTEVWTECPASRRRDFWEKFQKTLSSFQKTNSTQTIRSVFADRIEQVKGLNLNQNW